MSIAEILSLVSTICYVLAGISLALAVFFWIFYKIPSVIGDLSGRTAKKSIARMRQTNEQSGNKVYRASPRNEARGKLTETMQHTGEPKKRSGKLKTSGSLQKQVAVDVRPETGVLGENAAGRMNMEETQMLDGSEATTLLTNTEETMPLAQSVCRSGGKMLTMLTDVMLIHTGEVIK